MIWLMRKGVFNRRKKNIWEAQGGGPFRGLENKTCIVEVYRTEVTLAPREEARNI